MRTSKKATSSVLALIFGLMIMLNIPIKAYGEVQLTPIGVALNWPNSLVVHNNYIYVADTGNGVIKRMDLDGSNIVDLGSGLNSPTGLAVDENYIYISDSSDSTIKRMDLNGGNVTTLGSGFDRPCGVSVDSSGNIYVSDTFNHKVKKMDASGGNITELGSGFQFPFAIKVSGNNVYVADNNLPSIIKMDLNGNGLVQLGNGFGCANGVDIDSNGNIYVADQSNGVIMKMDAEGNNLTTAANIDGVIYVAVDSNLNLYAIQFGSVASINKVVITSPNLPQIITNPSDKTITVGDNASFTVSASGSSLIYQWQVYEGNGFVNISDDERYSGTTSDTLNITGATTDMSGYKYKVVVGSTEIESGQASEAATLTVNAATHNEIRVTAVDVLQDISVANGTDISNLNLPETVDVTLSDSSTTSAAVTWNDGNPEYEGETARTYAFTGTLKLPNGVTNTNDLKASVNVIVKAAGGNQSTTPAAVSVIIEGTTKVGQTLTGQLIDENGNSFTTSAAVTYEWYRLDASSSDLVNEIGTGKTYTLTSSDLNKYIGLIATYDENSFDAVSGKVLASSSSSSSSSSHHHSTTSIKTEDTSLPDTSTKNNDSNKTGWSKDVNGEWKFIESSGNKATGWKLVDNKWYFFNNKSGTMVTGWYKSETGDWTYNGQDTVNQWFHLDADGKLTTGWYKDTDGNWYYLCNGSQYGALGVMKTGWIYVDGNWYYLYSDGSMASNTAIDGYKLNVSGAWII